MPRGLAVFARLTGKRRLNSQLKLSGSTTQLALKTDGPLQNLPMKLSSSSPDNGLKLKLGDNSTAGYGIQGLPGMYVGGSAPATAEDLPKNQRQFLRSVGYLRASSPSWTDSRMPVLPMSLLQAKR